MSRRRAISNARRLKSAVQRTEQEPYDFTSTRRLPRIGAVGGHGWCQLGSTLNPATGSWGSITPTSQTGITIYCLIDGTPTAIPGTHKVYNWRNVTWAPSKTTYVVPNGDGTWDVVDQDC